MENISARQLAFLLKIPVDDANRKIITILLKQGVKRDKLFKKESDGGRVFEVPISGQSINIDSFTKESGIDIRLAIESIKKDYLNNTATRAYIMDLPEKKLIPGKGGLYPIAVGIPPVLKTFLTSKQIQEIIDKWNEIYAKHPAIEKFGTVFKP
jgi:hypothetical protein